MAVAARKGPSLSISRGGASCTTVRRRGREARLSLVEPATWQPPAQRQPTTIMRHAMLLRRFVSGRLLTPTEDRPSVLKRASAASSPSWQANRFKNSQQAHQERRIYLRTRSSSSDFLASCTESDPQSTDGKGCLHILHLVDRTISFSRPWGMLYLSDSRTPPLISVQSPTKQAA